MSDKSSENYLDNLLGSINGSASFSGEQETEDKGKKEPEDGAGNILFEESKTSADDEFLRAFEAELESDAYREYFADFEAELEAEQQRKLKQQRQESTASGDMEAILKDIEEISMDVEPVPAMPDPGTESAEAVLEAIEKQESAHRELGKLESFDDIREEKTSRLTTAEKTDEEDVEEIKSLDELDRLLSEIGDIGETGDGVEEAPYKVTDEGEPDLAGNSDDQLDDILAAADGLSDIGDLLNGEGTDGEDTIGEYAKMEMQQEENAGEKGKKAGCMAKLKAALFGGDEEDTNEKQEMPSGKDSAENLASELSDENRQILKELEGEENARKGKKKKEKKIKQEKPKKEKKVREKKAPKPKKEKVREVDNTPPLPKGPVVLILLMVASLTALILLGTSLFGYSSGISEAKSLYQKKSYTDAYASLQGLEIKETDEALYEKLQTLAAVDSQYQSYLVFRAYGDEVSALDSLVCAAGRCDLNLDAAEEHACEEELAALGEKIESALVETYGISMDEAIEIYNQHNRTEYSILLHSTLAELGLE